MSYVHLQVPVALDQTSVFMGSVMCTVYQSMLMASSSVTPGTHMHFTKKKKRQGLDIIH